MKKPIIIHYHIFKNAGSTIEGILRRNFKDKAKQFDDISRPRVVLQNRRLLDFLIRNPNTKSISSHQLRFPPPTHPDWKFLSIIFIRHPIDRAFSIYSFKKRDTSPDEYGTLAKKLDAKEFIRFNLNSDYRVMRDFQTLFLSHMDNISNTSRLDLDIAFSALKQTYFGIVDRMDESLVLIEEELKKYFHGIDLSYVKQNVSMERDTTLTDRLESASEDIGDELMKTLIHNNNLDLTLYEYANKELESRLNRIENVEKRIEEFRLRCKKIESNLHDKF